MKQVQGMWVETTKTLSFDQIQDNSDSTAPLMEENINLIFVGWVERSETQH